MSLSEAPVFLPLPTFEKVAYANLSENSSDWVHDITKMLYEKLPFLAQFPTRVKIDRIEERMGYGYGAITVSGALSVPLIIKAFELAPMDVFIHRNRFAPLSERRVEEILFNPDMFGKPVDTAGMDVSIYPSNYPPHGGKYVYAAHSILSRLNGLVTEADKKYLAAKLAEPGMFAAFKQSGTLSLLKRAALITPRKHVDPNSILPVNVLQAEKIAGDKFVVRATSDRLYAPKETTVDKRTLWDKLGAAAAREVLESGVYTTVQGARPWKPVMVEELKSDEAKPIRKHGRYEVMDVDGDRRLGWVFPNVVDFDLHKLGDKVFTDGLSYALQGDIVGIPATSPARPEQKDETPIAELENGKHGCFVFMRGGESLCTIPFSVISPIFDQGTHIRFEAMDEYGRPFVVEVTSGVKSITRSTHQTNTYTVPADAQFIDIGRKVVRLQDANSGKKIDSDAIKASADSTVIVTCDDGNVFNLAGAGLGDLVADARGVGQTKAKWYLVSLGCSPSEADHVLERARKDGRAKIVGTKVLITQAEKQAEVMRDRVIPLLTKVGNLKRDYVKEAAFLDDESTADKVLGLNFVTPENTQIFVEFLPAYEDAVSKLAHLLIAIRLGLKHVPEPAAKSSMDGLEVVIAALRNMEALRNVGGQNRPL